MKDKEKELVEKESTEKKETKKLGRKQKEKKYGKILMMISFFFIPALIASLIIASHSDRLINSTMETILQVLLGLFVGLFLVGGYFFIKRRKEKIDPFKPLIRVGYTIVMICYLVCEVFCLVLFYGPNTDFRDWLVTTAMATMNHHYYCEWFYSDEEIEEVFSRNYIAEPDGSTNTSPLTEMPPVSPDGVYVNEYEEAVLKRDPGTLYKIIRFKVNNCNAYLAVIYDPSKVGVTTTKYVGKYGQYVTEMAQREKAVVAINGAGFQDPGHSSTGGRPTGITIVDGKIVTNNQYGRPKSGGLIGFNKENKLLLLKNVSASEALEMGIRDAVSWGPFLFVNGKAAFTKGNGGWGYAARTAIGQREDGIVLFLVVDSNASRSKGASMVDMTNIMKNYGAINATNLDGGTSSVIVENGKLINDPIDSTLAHRTRPIATSFIVTE